MYMNSQTPSTVVSDRSRGRPLNTNQAQLKTAILLVAEQLFTDNGYAGTSIRNIADSAGVNPALVHYYFGNKHALLESVFKRALEPMIEALAKFQTNEQASVVSISELLINMATEHPNIPKLMTREVLLPGGEMREYFIQHLAPKLGGTLPALIQHEKNRGKINSNVEPAYAALMVIALSIFPFIARTLAEPVLGIDYSPDGVDTLKQHISEFIKQGLTP